MFRLGHGGRGGVCCHGFARSYNQTFSCHYYQNSHYNRSSIFRPCTIVVTVIFFSIVFTFLVLSLVLRSTYTATDGDNTNTYTSRDMTTVTYSHMFCDELGLKGSKHTSVVKRTLYLLNKKPPITRKEMITFSKEITLQQTYKYWMFHLLPSSAIELTACISSGSANIPTFYLVKGANRFKKLKYKAYSIKKTVQEICPGGKDHHVFFKQEIKTDDQYYLIFQSKHASPSLKLTFNITQMLYNITQDIVIDNCTVLPSTASSCRLQVPLYSNPTALLALQPQEGNEIDWEARSNVEVHCHPRTWIYVLVCLSGGLAVVFIILTIVGFFYLFRHRKNAAYTTVTGSATNNSQVAVPSVPSPPERTPLLRFGTNPQELDSYVYKFEAPPPYKP